MKTIEEILKNYSTDHQDERSLSYSDVVEAMKEFGRQERDKALDWAAQNVDLTHYLTNDQKRLSILKGKSHPDLSI